MRSLILFLIASVLYADPLVSVINLGSMPGPLSAIYKGKPAVLVMVYNEAAVVGQYTVILPWTDRSGAAQTTSQECRMTGVNTACVFEVDSVAQGTATASWWAGPTELKLEERK